MRYAAQRNLAGEVACAADDEDRQRCGGRRWVRRPRRFEDDQIALRRPVRRASLIRRVVAGLQSMGRLRRRFDDPDLILFLAEHAIVAGEGDPASVGTDTWSAPDRMRRGSEPLLRRRRDLVDVGLLGTVNVVVVANGGDGVQLFVPGRIGHPFYGGSRTAVV